MVDTTFAQLPKDQRDKVIQQAKVAKEEERQRLKMEMTGMSAASHYTTTSVEKFLKNAVIEKQKHMSYENIQIENSRIKAEPAIMSEKKKKFLEKQSKMQEIAMQLYEKKKKEQPTLATPVKKQIYKKLK